MFFRKYFFQCYIVPTNRVGEGQEKQAVVKEKWERGEIVICIAVPATSILAKSSQLIKYSLSSNS